MTQDKRTITPAQAAAIAEYRTAYRSNDFNRKVFALDGLASVGLCESKATELIAMGYHASEST